MEYESTQVYAVYASEDDAYKVADSLPAYSPYGDKMVYTVVAKEVM